MTMRIWPQLVPRLNMGSRDRGYTLGAGKESFTLQEIAFFFLVYTRFVVARLRSAEQFS